MKKEIYTCDGCGKVKGDVNHWYAVWIGADLEARVVIVSFATSLEQESTSARTWEHFCGEECLLKMVARNLPK